MWVIHVVGMPKSGKTEVAKSLGGLLVPFFNTFDIRVKYIEIGGLVEQYYDQAKIDKRMTSLLYKGPAPKELLELYYKALDPSGINIVVGARESVFFDSAKYIKWAGKKAPENMYNVVVKVMASKNQRLTRGTAKAVEKENAEEEAYGLSKMLDEVWQCTINNETASDLAEAPVKVLMYILTHTDLLAARGN